MKTLKEWLEELPDGIRENALDQCSPEVLGARVNSLLDAIETFAIWSETRDGYIFWAKVASMRHLNAIRHLKWFAPEVYNEYYKQHIEK